MLTADEDEAVGVLIQHFSTIISLIVDGSWLHFPESSAIFDNLSDGDEDVKDTGNRKCKKKKKRRMFFPSASMMSIRRAWWFHPLLSFNKLVLSC